MLNRYGEYVERDLAYTRFSLRDFFTGGTQPVYTLANIIRMFENTSTSWTSHAYTTDTDIYAATLDENGNPPEPKGLGGRPNSTEFGTIANLLATIVERLEANNHYTAGQKGKPKIQRVPRPDTAAALYERQRVKEMREELLSVLNFDNNDE